MAKPPRDRAETASRTYFVTASTWEGRSLFQSERLAQLFLETLHHYRRQSQYRLHEYVVMRDHFHLLVTPREDATLERCMQFIKGGFSRRAGEELGRNVEIWQRGYVDHRIRDGTDYARHREYIRQNPVEAKLSSRAEEYRYSSAHPDAELDPPPQGLKPLNK